MNNSILFVLCQSFCYRACIANLYITIPSIINPSSRFMASMRAIYVSLLANSLPQVFLFSCFYIFSIYFSVTLFVTLHYQLWMTSIILLACILMLDTFCPFSSLLAILRIVATCIFMIVWGISYKGFAIFIRYTNMILEKL